MKILFKGHDFKYETEATVKLFVPSRFTFHYDITDADGDIVMSQLKECRQFTYLFAYCRINGMKARKAYKISNESSDINNCEHEICRLIYLCLQKLTGITPPWGLMTGIRPVKKMSALIENGMSKGQAFKALKNKYMVSDRRLELAYMTAVNQMPLLKQIDSDTVSLYVSIPFCPSRCSYCSFVSHSIESARKLIPDYIRFLCREIEILGKIIRDLNLKIDTVYFGGGTPTSVEASQLNIIMKTLSENIDVSKVREYNVEAGRADTITIDKLKVIKENGATRISVNPQTLNDEVLKIIGRRHTAEDTINAFYSARSLGFDNINMDLIAGLPGEDASDMEDTLRQVEEMHPDSLTVHALAIKRAARYGQEGRKQDLHSEISQMIMSAADCAKRIGLQPYYLYRQKNIAGNFENVGYAELDKAGIYNILIMEEKQTILAAGAGASTKILLKDPIRTDSGKEINLVRCENVKNIMEYIDRVDEMIERKGEWLWR